MLSKSSDTENVDLPVTADLHDSTTSNTTSTNNNTNEDSNTNRKMVSTSITTYSREILCLFALILTTYAGIQNRHTRTLSIYQPSNPLPIFGTDKDQFGSSYVQEWPKGMLSGVQTRVTMSEISVILFYAPWCENSHFVISAYESLAKIFYKEIYFAAVNCWQPGGDCRLQHTKVKTWPVIVVYLSKGTAIQYNGPLQLRSLYKFLASLLNPIQRLHSLQELMFLQSMHNVIAVGFFRKINFKYQTYYQAALKWHEHDTFQDLIKFTAVTGKTVNNFGIGNTNKTCIRLYIANMPDTIIEQCRKKWSTDEIVIWFKENVKLLPKIWYNLNIAERNNSLIDYIRNGPTLLYFTRRDFINNGNDIAYDILRIVFEINSKSINYDFKNCTLTAERKYRKPLSYHLLDSYTFYKFAEKLGVTTARLQSRTAIEAVVIIDNATESVYHMRKSTKDPVSVFNLRKFINDFQLNNRNLSRYLRKKSLNNTESTDKYVQSNEICIPEIDQRQFHRILRKRKNDITTIILITSTACPLCQLLILNLLKISRTLAEVKSIEFFKLDGNENDFLWQYTMGTYPTLVIFPKNNQSGTDIRVFPNYLKPNEKNLFGFILATYDDNLEQLKLILKYCSKMLYGFANCVKKSRLIILDIIADKLRSWKQLKNNPLNRKHILKELHSLNILYYSILKAKNPKSLHNIDIYLNVIS